MIDLEQYRASERERMRTEDLLRLLPQGRTSVLDIGARDGHFSRLLTHHFEEVTALDLSEPAFRYPGVTTVAGDITNLQFEDNSFDCVFCAEVLEHIPDVRRACQEIARVARYEMVIGVPFRQDTRLGRTRCPDCGETNPPWGHVNTFDERRLMDLFDGHRVISTSFVGFTREVTNPLSALLMDLGGHPWGTYGQDESCIHCGAELKPPARRTLPQKICSGLSVRLTQLQTAFVKPRGIWMHAAFAKEPSLAGQVSPVTERSYMSGRSVTHPSV